jgi:hypothetical protein
VQVASSEIAIVQFLDGYAVTKIIPGKLFTSSWIKKEPLARIIRLLEALQDGGTALFHLYLGTAPLLSELSGTCPPT